MRPPRQVASDYINAGNDKEKQKQAVKGYPKHLQGLVKSHIKIARDRNV